VGKFPEIGKLLERSKLENMVVSRDGCTVDHPNDECPLDRGAAVCIEASKNGRLMLDPYWLGGATRHVRRTVPRVAVLLAKDPVLPWCRRCSRERPLVSWPEAASGRHR